ncbi:MAG: DNA repair protein RecO [Coriobacteriales bacterium]|nr:DNA repair protein RecO [Coriobacteriales bacterium]
MATYKTRALVVKKTKLKEADLILTLLAENGEQVRAVAKGARKPGTTFSARLEIFSVVDAMLYKGKNLDTITEVRSVDTNEASRRDLEHLSYGAVISEFVEKVALEGEENPVLFPLTCAALQSVGRVEADALPFVIAGYLLKAISYLGYRPSIGLCTVCGASKEGYAQEMAEFADEVDLDAEGVFSISAGGWVCPLCSGFGELEADDIVSEPVVAWVKALIGLKFPQIEEMFSASEDAGALAGELLSFCDKWIYAHLETHMRSLAYLSRL